MRIMTLNDMLADLRNEARLSSDVAHGSHLQERHIALLRRVQEQLYGNHDWPNLTITQTVEIPAGQRFTGFPPGVIHDAVQNVFIRPADNSAKWRELTFGVRTEDLNEFDSDADERSANVRRWQPYQSLDAEQTDFSLFELWPIPAVAVKVRFEAKRQLAPLADPDVDKSTIDGPVIVLFAAAELLAAQKSEDTPLKIEAARARLRLLKETAAPGDNRRVSMVPGATRTARSRVRIGE